jgi:hypothetical protein
VLLKPVSAVRGIIAADKMSKLESITMRQIYVRRRKIKEESTLPEKVRRNLLDRKI